MAAFDLRYAVSEGWSRRRIYPSFAWLWLVIPRLRDFIPALRAPPIKPVNHEFESIYLYSLRYLCGLLLEDLYWVEPTTGFEPVTYGLRNRCSTS